MLTQGKFRITPSKLMASLEVARATNSRPLSAPPGLRRRRPPAPPKAGERARSFRGCVVGVTFFGMDIIFPAWEFVSLSSLRRIAWRGCLGHAMMPCDVMWFVFFKGLFIGNRWSSPQQVVRLVFIVRPNFARSHSTPEAEQEFEGRQGSCKAVLLARR